MSPAGSMGYRPSCTGFGSIFDEEGKQSRLKEIEALLHAQEFWSDPSRAQKILKEQRALKEVVDQLEAPGRELEDLSVLLQLLREEEDQQVLAEMESSLQKLEQKLAELELTTVLAGEYDRGNAILSINPGAGGTESQDWAQMLLRMYLRWAGGRGCRGAGPGPPPGAGARGGGGKHVNVTDSAVRITPLPTGIVVSCQNERSQHKNRAVAMKVLRARLYELEIEKKRAASQKGEDGKLGINFGTQIRSYVLHPYRMIKDLRTRVEVGDVDRVLDGDLEPFIRAYLLSRRGGAKTGE